jgi:hypothetical protein
VYKHSFIYPWVEDSTRNLVGLGSCEVLADGMSLLVPLHAGGTHFFQRDRVHVRNGIQPTQELNVVNVLLTTTDNLQSENQALAYYILQYANAKTYISISSVCFLPGIS